MLYCKVGKGGNGYAGLLGRVTKDARNGRATQAEDVNQAAVWEGCADDDDDGCETSIFSDRACEAVFLLVW